MHWDSQANDYKLALLGRQPKQKFFLFSLFFESILILTIFSKFEWTLFTFCRHIEEDKRDEMTEDELQTRTSA